MPWERSESELKLFFNFIRQYNTLVTPIENGMECSNCHILNMLTY